MEQREASGWTSTRNTTYTVYHNGAWAGMSALSAFLLFTCALLAGLTLALCSLNLTWLEVISATGDIERRKQAAVVAKLRRRSSWMLCSLIICSVACGESLPVVIQSICHSEQPWVPILISTLLIAIVAEILPQYIIPRNALAWGYHCRPIVWACMWVTCILSFPLAWMLDHLSEDPDEQGIFTNAELAVLVKHHEKRENRGGQLGRDTSRVMLGALKLGSCRLSGVATSNPHAHESNGRDIEKGETVLTRGLMITNWSAVKTININEPVDKAFIQKVMNWSYSRIPVIGESDGHEGDCTIRSWSKIKIFGFLHIKNLIGLNIRDNHDPGVGLLVKDLSLYPLPIVRQDMAAYDLLDMFQLGMSRMALVILPPDLLGDVQSRDDWTADFLEAARRSSHPSIPQRDRIFGIRSPEPLGIITYEDIIERILQKGGRDEKDFFDRGLTEPFMKSKKEHVLDHASSQNFTTIASDTTSNTPIGVQGVEASGGQSSSNGSLRRRHISQDKGKGRAIDAEKAVGGLDGADDASIILHRSRTNTESSYTQNSQGGFHHADESALSSGHCMVLTRQHLVELGAYPVPLPSSIGSSLSCTKSNSLPTRQLLLFPGLMVPSSRNFSTADVPQLPRLRRVTPFSRQNYSSFEKMADQHEEKVEMNLCIPSLVFPQVNEKSDIRSRVDESDVDMKEAEESSVSDNRNPEISGDTISIASWYYSNFGSQFDITNLPESVDLSPDAQITGKRTSTSDYTSNTLPSMNNVAASYRRVGATSSCEIRPRDESFHDDRAMLPSQHRSIMNSSQMRSARSTSLWF